MSDNPEGYFNEDDLEALIREDRRWKPVKRKKDHVWSDDDEDDDEWGHEWDEDDD